MSTIKKYLKRIGLGLLLLPIVLTLFGSTYQAAASAIDKRNFPPPGQLVDVGGYKMHIYCVGEGSPTVILDSANMGTVSNWAWVQPDVAKVTRVCAYDRADSGWSDLSAEPNDIKQNAEVLHTLLDNASMAGPYVLITIDDANHISLVDRQEHALQTSAVILKVIEAVHLSQPLQ